MFKIGEFSKLGQVSIRMLRYYDEAGLLKPAKTDAATGYRLYEAGQIDTLNRILFLRDLGFGVPEIAGALGAWDDEGIAARLAQKRLEIEGEIAATGAKLAKIELAQRDILQKRIAVNANVSIKAVPACPVLALRRRVGDYYAEGALWQELSAFAKARGVQISGQAFTVYHDLDYREKDVDIELCAPVAKPGQSEGDFVYRSTEAVPVMASTMVHGPFGNIAGAYKVFAAWLQAHDRYKMQGASRQIVHRGPWNEAEQAKYLTEIQVPLQAL